ncbi:hypothetical protein, partial [Helicobacter pylori]|uniref:hypothetical protein n=1 Tax=Helicobacter pylori TaxID=210 RepID=UPI003C6C8F59
MRYNQSILKRIEKAKEKEKDLANYGTCVAIGDRRRLGDISANAIKNYKILCNACADKILIEAFKKTFIQAFFYTAFCDFMKLSAINCFSYIFDFFIKFITYTITLSIRV